MRDGQYVNTVRTDEIEISEVISMMVGRTIYEEPKSRSTVPQDAPVVLSVEHLESVDVHDVSFELSRARYGVRRTDGRGAYGDGAPDIRGGSAAGRKDRGKRQEVDIQAPQDAVKHVIGYLSEDRKRYGLAVGLSVAENIILADMDKFTPGGIVNKGRVKAQAKEYVDRIDIKTPSINQLVRNLSEEISRR
jgi:ribose transport system ATP-binding protein